MLSTRLFEGVVLYQIADEINRLSAPFRTVSLDKTMLTLRATGRTKEIRYYF